MVATKEQSSSVNGLEFRRGARPSASVKQLFLVAGRERVWCLPIRNARRRSVGAIPAIRYAWEPAPRLGPSERHDGRGEKSSVERGDHRDEERLTHGGVRDEP